MLLLKVFKWAGGGIIALVVVMQTHVLNWAANEAEDRSLDPAHYNYVLAAVGNQEVIWVYCIPSFSAIKISSALFGSGPELRVQTDLS